ncbi:MULTISPECIES: PAS domain-containing sensor histidine kinase [unclassified Massilia]|uniref:sensor histidine kinase n=1 Tax=unclassified Massilia TaxID=2609279 RepID=UPI001B82C0A5|nr:MULTISPECIES: HAMP domain-containing sensor histidine kinase [unclassified Massilia]MBQ5941925.1 HAMP domain-containing histidine kinase [Massilia sp. AB1]MBQ5965035.1 HAMP domain-containing histidine kinase [Massilia sp. ZL223]
MASRRVQAAGVVLAVAGVGALSWGAGALHASPRLAVLCLLGILPCLFVLWRCVRGLASWRPDPAAATAVLNIEQQSLVDNALALEARLEFAPIALFRIDGASGPGTVAPLNANARKLTAPGRATDPAELYAQLAAQPAERRATMQFETERGAERALVAVASISLHGKPQRLAALMPVETELEAEALNAWRQLVHVLTHEIMNSLTPVASLSHTAYDLVREAEGLDPDLGADLGTALDAIRRRADSLVAFVASYRSLSNVPEAHPERIRLAEMFERIGALVNPLWRARGGMVEFSVEPGSLELVADPGQLEQALINLLKNAFEATAGVEKAQAKVSARLVRGARLRIEVADDGPGVPEDVAAHIFTPFFTTKKQGGGIGLAMVRHLVHANGGTVRYARPVGKGARFIISF